MMIDPDTITRFLTEQGITHYLLMDREGTVLNQNMEHPENASRSLFQCFQHLLSVGKQNFRHAVFSTDDHSTLILFALDDTLLSVVSDQDGSTLVAGLDQLTRS